MKYIIALFAVAICTGCVCPGPITVNVLSSRLVVAQSSTNDVSQKIDGGASTSGEIALGDSAIKAVADSLTGQLPALVEKAVREYMAKTNATRSTP